MKQQMNDAELYQKLRGAFHMQPEQMHRLEQSMQAAVKAAASKPDAEHPAADSRRLKSGGYWFAAHALPLAICLVLAVSGTMLLRQTFRQPDITDSQPSTVEVIEQTLPPGTDAGSADTLSAVTAVSTEAQTEVSASAAAEQTTVTETPASEPMTTASETQQQEDETAAEQTEILYEETAPAATAAEDVPETVTTNAVMETALPETTTAVTETEPPLLPDADLYLADCTVRAGGTVRVSLICPEELSFAGIQFLLEERNDSGLMAQITAVSSGCADLFDDEAGIVINNTGTEVYYVLAVGDNVTVPGGTDLLTLTLEIPADVPAGTVWSFRLSSLHCILQDDTDVPLDVSLGILTVTEG